jgi:hypothetical protein
MDSLEAAFLFHESVPVTAHVSVEDMTVLLVQIAL